MKKHYPCHTDELVRLRRIEGQIRGAQKMIDEGRYCVDILRTLNAAVGAIKKTEDQILKRHLDGCVTKAFQSSSTKERDKKLNEVLNLVSDFRKY
ncbi:MAG: metal-sensitive transcriptional regulator [Candidatus Omnitrophica bacterium]|nr:metal-sensitive transcriptional regulator [Candidatus Omnitrophota bacterium]